MSHRIFSYPKISFGPVAGPIRFDFNDRVVTTGTTADDSRNGRQRPSGQFAQTLSAARALGFTFHRVSLQSVRSETRLFGRLGHLAVVLALALSLASPWMLLQTVAWAGMMVNFSQKVTFPQAVGMTLDGQHPCNLCKEIAAGKAKQSQHSSQSVPTGQDLKFAFPPPSILLIHPPTPGVPPDAPVLPCARSETPPTPPPRFA